MNSERSEQPNKSRSKNQISVQKSINENNKFDKEDSSDTIVFVTPSGHKYHKESCICLKKTRIPKNLNTICEYYQPCLLCFKEEKTDQPKEVKQDYVKKSSHENKYNQDNMKYVKNENMNKKIVSYENMNKKNVSNENNNKKNVSHENTNKKIVSDENKIEKSSKIQIQTKSNYYTRSRSIDLEKEQKNLEIKIVSKTKHKSNTKSVEDKKEKITIGKIINLNFEKETKNPNYTIIDNTIEKNNNEYDLVFSKKLKYKNLMQENCFYYSIKLEKVGPKSRLRIGFKIELEDDVHSGENENHFFLVEPRALEGNKYILVLHLKESKLYLLDGITLNLIRCVKVIELEDTKFNLAPCICLLREGDKITFY